MTIKLDMIGIVVKDMKKALDFYRALGFDVPAEQDGQPHVEIQQDGVRIAFDKVETAREVYGGWEEPSGHRIELAFACDGASAVDELYGKITELGYASVREPWDAFWGQRYAVVADPDGNQISLFA
ncbi:VOC family protein [Paenibacillus sacheonensis]|uniref:Glyoxalase n=1 Tax=Paenibacillus sacheonensis TaxID=742054 RepID=A0A7X5C3V2_9BACL|nr:VOC family protein [Paenibacillus sacheonensis]MBM7569271.1 catechol 2,3-dioxygenase-like lactoylglutathione lyase family enzyme [Paenibacillus sacheonensis]NBC71719.1 glyoxalase [Paenibacillus sacheonensis]